MYGARDTGLGASSLEDLQQLANHVVIRVPEAGHPAYMDNPTLWHTVLYNFLVTLSS